MTALGLLICAIWIYLLVFRGRFWLFADPPDPGPAPAASVTAVMPARNEAEVIARSLQSLSKQQYPGPFRIVVVDDHSDDGTAAIAAPFAEVIRAKPLPLGWTGKLWAVSQGVTQAGEPEYLLLTDADIVHAPANLASLVARARAGNYDLVSYMAKLRCESFAERALIPAFVFFFFMLYPPAWATGAAGGCMLIRREALERIGGIAAIRGELIDDCALAKAVKQSGGRVWLGLNHSVESIRVYGSVAEIAHMISRTAFTQLNYSATLLAATLAGLALVYLAPPALTLAGNPWGAPAWLMMSIAYLPALRYYRRSPLWAPLLPLIAAFYMGCTLASALQHWRGAGGAWKGRVASQWRRPPGLRS